MSNRLLPIIIPVINVVNTLELLNLENEISSHHVTSRDNLAPKNIRGVPGLRAH